MAKKYTNVRPPHLATVVTQVSSPSSYRPFISKGAVNGLTPKEKEARKIKRTADVGGSFGGGNLNTSLASAGQFFSPQLSTDFLELPQSLREKREIYRHFYNSDPVVGQSIDLHTELPLSKVRLATPKPTTYPEGFKDAHDYASYILWFFTEMCSHTKLFQRLVTMVHHYWLDGGCVVWAEDSAVDVPPEIGYDKKQTGTRSIVTDSGDTKEEPEFGFIEREDRENQELAHYQKNYMGWDRLIILPIDQVKLTTYSFTDKMRVELIPADRDRALVSQAKMGDPVAEEMVKEIPEEVREHLENGKLIPLGTDPDEGSFCFYLAGRRGAGEDLGQSILDRCHLPGTLVLTKRGEIIDQIPIEDLDPDTDQVLSSNGIWRDFEVGARLISESISLLHVSKIYPPIGCTKDHKYPVLRDNQVIELIASEIKPGDYLQVAQIPLTETIHTIDLADFMDGIEGEYKALKSGNESDLQLKVTDKTEDSFTVEYRKDQTNPRKINRNNNLNTILEWASELTEPVSMKSAEICEKFGLHAATFKDMRKQLVSFGYGITVTKNKSIIFPPNLEKLQTSTSANHIKNFSRFLHLDADFGYFIGFWLGDGHIAKKQTGLEYGSLSFTYGPDEVPSVASIEKKIKPMLNLLRIPWAESPIDAGIHLSGLHDALVRWMAQNFGHTCDDKHLPAWIFDAPKSFLFGLLRGFVDSDGDVVYRDWGSISVRFSNSNASLMDQVFLVCTSLGIPVSKTKPTEERWVKQATGEMSWAKPSYSVHFTHGPFVKMFFESGFLAKRKDPDAWKDGRSGSRHVQYQDKLYYRVEEVGSAKHTGSVYSLNVHEDHSFYSCGVATRNCLRVLYFRDKLRQAQTQIASRAMTPKRIIWADRISEMDVNDLREQVDLALVDPDYSIVANYEVHWEEMGARDRLLDLSNEYEITDKQLHAGLGVTESLLSGETLYSGDRLKLEVINTRYMFLREMIQDYVENYLFKPVARRKGFVEKNAWGGEVVLYPKLSFTRLPLRDSQDTYDALFNLYQKGSIPISVILELFNLDPDDIKIKLEEDLFTVNDAVCNEVLRSIYGSAAQPIVDGTNVVDRIIEALKLKKVAPKEEPSEGRF